MGNRPENLEDEILPEEIVRKTTDFEHTQQKNGKVLFRVIAGSSTMKTGGDNILERVSLWRFGVNGEPSDMIESEEAVYNPNKDEILFTGDVVIRLERGILIYADQVKGDLARETLRISENYRLEYESVLGEGKGLEYLFLSRRLGFINGINLVMNEISGKKEIEARNGQYLMDSGKITLAGNARIESLQSTMQGDRIEIELDKDDQIEKLSSWGNARLIPARENVFSGAGIFMDIKNNFLTILGSADNKAIFIGGSEPDARELSSDAIYCSFFSGPESSWKLNKIKAEGNVSLELPESKLDECRGEFFQGVLAPGKSGKFETVNLSGNVYLSHISPDSSKETMQGQNLWIEMDSEGVPGLVRIEKDVIADLSHSPGAGKGKARTRHLEVQDLLLMNYEKGVLQQISGRLGCLVTGSTGEQEDKLESDSILLEFRKGDLSRASADGSVRGEGWDGTTRKKLNSDHLDLFYEDGILTAFEQSGSVVLQEKGSDRNFEIQAEHSRFESGTKVLTVEQGRPLLIVLQSDAQGTRRFETRARQISINSEDNLLKAVGSVESIYDMKELPLVFVSSYMESDLTSGKVEYSGDVKLLLEENIIKGDKMRLDTEKRELSVEGSVDSKLLTRNLESYDEYRISSGKLDLDTVAGTASYQEEVKFDTEGLRIESPFLVLYMETGQMKEFSRVEAWGGVTISEEGRVWTGERAEFLKETGKVVVD